MMCIVLSIGVYPSPERATASAVQNAGAVKWGTPELVFENVQGIWYSEPVAAFDLQNQPHVFWGVAGANTSGGSVAAVDAQMLHSYRANSAWQPSLDVLAADNVPALVRPRVRLDRYGRFNLLLSGGAGTSRELWSAADSSLAHSAQGWSPLEAISHDVAFDADLAVTKKGDLHVVYAVTGAGMRGDLRGVYDIALAPASEIWSAPQLVAPANEQRGISEVRVALDAKDCLHVVWSETPLTGYPPDGIYYASSCDSGQTWTPTTLVLGPDVGNPRIVAVGADEIHVTALGRVGKLGSYHRWSRDGGATWQAEDAIEPSRQGLSGAGLSADSAGHVYFVFADANQQQVSVTQWSDGAWSTPRSITGDVRPGEGRIFEQVSLSVGAGNRLSVAFQEFSAKAEEQLVTRIWYVEGQTDAPEIVLQLEPQPRSDTQPTITPAPTTAPTPAVTPTPEYLADWSKLPPTSSEGSAQPMIISLVLTVAVIGGVMAWRVVSTRRR